MATLLSGAGRLTVPRFMRVQQEASGTDRYASAMQVRQREPGPE